MTAGVRRANAVDVPALVEMGLRFLASPEYAGLVVGDRGRLTTMATAWFSIPDAAAWVAEQDDGTIVGMIAMLVYEHTMSVDRVAVEVAWWVDPEAPRAGVALLHAAEQWAKEQGATVLNMVAPNDRVGAFYEKKGFTLVERSYQRRV